MADIAAFDVGPIVPRSFRVSRARLFTSVACAVVTGLVGWLTLELVWRWRVTTKYRARHHHLASAT